MKQYSMQTLTTASGIPWRHDFSQPSDEMAKEYAKRITKQFANVPWFIGMWVWNITSGSEKLVAHIVCDVSVTVKELPI